MNRSIFILCSNLVDPMAIFLIHAPPPPMANFLIHAVFGHLVILVMGGILNVSATMLATKPQNISK